MITGARMQLDELRSRTTLSWFHAIRSAVCIATAPTSRSEEQVRMSIKVSSNFDCGNIEVIDASNPQAIRLNIRKEQTGELQDYILSNLQGAGDVHDMYDRSLEIEPREREDEKIARYEVTSREKIALLLR